jgi:hypothetical protein
MNLRILAYSVPMILAICVVAYALHEMAPSSTLASTPPAPTPPAVTETTPVAEPTEKPKHVRTHLELVNFVQSHLSVEVTNERREREYLYVYGTLTNNTNAALRWVGVTVTAYNAEKQVVNDRSLYPTGSGYLQSGQTVKFSTMMHDEGGEIVHMEAVVEPVDNMVLNSALFQ